MSTWYEQLGRPPAPRGDIPGGVAAARLSRHHDWFLHMRVYRPGCTMKYAEHAVYQTFFEQSARIPRNLTKARLPHPTPLRQHGRNDSYRALQRYVPELGGGWERGISRERQVHVCPTRDGSRHAVRSLRSR